MDFKLIIACCYGIFMISDQYLKNCSIVFVIVNSLMFIKLRKNPKHLNILINNYNS